MVLFSCACVLEVNRWLSSALTKNSGKLAGKWRLQAGKIVRLSCFMLQAKELATNHEILTGRRLFARRSNKDQDFASTEIYRFSIFFTNPFPFFPKPVQWNWYFLQTQVSGNLYKRYSWTFSSFRCLVNRFYLSFLVCMHCFQRSTPKWQNF